MLIFIIVMLVIGYLYYMFSPKSYIRSAIWNEKLNWNIKKNNVIYQSFFDANDTYYKIYDSSFLDESCMTIILYLKEKVVTLTYNYENDFFEPKHEIKSDTDKITTILSQRNGWQMNRYTENIKDANPFDGNVEKAIDEMLAQYPRDWFSVDRPHLIAQLNQELNK